MNVCEWLNEVCSRKHFESSNSVAKNYISIRSFTIDCWDTDMVTDVHFWQICLGFGELEGQVNTFGTLSCSSSHS